MNYGQSQVLFTVSAIMKKGRTHYITPHPETMTKLLKKYHDYERSPQTYWRNTQNLESEGYIARHDRYDTRDRNNPRRLPSMITLTIKGAKYLMKMGNAWAGQILGAMLKWAKMGNKQSPQRTEVIYARAESHMPLIEMTDEFADTGKEAIRKIIEMLEAK